MTITARDIMNAKIVAVPSTMPLPELEDLLIARRVSGVPVVDKGVLVGIVSRSDIVRYFSLERSLAALLAEGLDQQEYSPGDKPDPAIAHKTELAGLQVKDIMVKDPVTVRPDTPVTEVAHLLVSRHLHRLLVTEGTDVRGIISTLDVVRLVAEGRVGEPG